MCTHLGEVGLATVFWFPKKPFSLIALATGTVLIHFTGTRYSAFSGLSAYLVRVAITASVSVIFLGCPPSSNMKSSTGTLRPVTSPTPTYPVPGMFTQTRFPGDSICSVLLYQVPPPPAMKPYFWASFHSRFSPA